MFSLNYTEKTDWLSAEPAILLVASGRVSFFKPSYTLDDDKHVTAFYVGNVKLIVKSAAVLLRFSLSRAVKQHKLIVGY